MNDDRPDSSDQGLRDLLDSAAPDQPDLPAAARTTAVRDRARVVRRRNGLVLAAAVLAVVGIGVGIPVLTSGDDPAPESGVAADPPPSVPVPGPPPECPAETPVIDQAGRATSAKFPDGATSVRLCPATSEQSFGGASEFTLPTAPVTDDVDGLLDAIGALPDFVMPAECASILTVPMPWVLIASYPDGSSVSVGTTTTACSSITVDGREVESAPALALVADAVAAATGTPTGS